MGNESPRLSRRDFLKTSTLGLAGAGLASVSMSALFRFDPALAADIPAPRFELEPQPVLKVLRWMGFVKSDEEIWRINTKKWEIATGGRVITDFIPWEDVRSRAAMESLLGTGHDIVFGWFDDPHLYPDRLLDVSEVADYLGSRYGGWYPVCEVYGRDARHRRWIALPLGSAGICLNYRVSQVQQAGFARVPNDVAGFLRCCKALKAQGHPTGFALGHAVGDANAWTHWWLWSFGGKAVEADGATIAINSRETGEALEAARELHDTMIPGVENWLDPHNNQAFLDGRISLTANGNSIFFASMQNFPDLNRDLMTMNFPVGPVGFASELSLFSLGFIFKHTQVPNAARHYLQFLFEKPCYGAWENGTWGFVTPTLKSYYDMAAWLRDPRITPYRECTSRMLWNGYAGPLGAASAAAMSEFIIVDMFAAVCTGGKTPKTAMLAAEKRLARLYRS
ncbi:MAG: ABC transporter substrate-binding protein [Thermodesulfobacteriota bacterium]